MNNNYDDDNKLIEVLKAPKNIILLIINEIIEIITVCCIYDYYF